jgi:hypothetical protein
MTSRQQLSDATLNIRRPLLSSVEYLRPQTSKEIALMLADTSDFGSATSLWNRYSGYQGLLDATAVPSKKEDKGGRILKYIVHLSLAYGLYRYIFKGQSIPSGFIRVAVMRVSRQVRDEVGALAEKMITGQIGRQEWYDLTQSRLKYLYRTVHVAGSGGYDNYGDEQEAEFVRQFSPQFHFLRQFVEETNTGEDPISRKIVSRIKLYANAGNPLYQDTLWRVAAKSGMLSAKRVLGETENHCHETASRPGCVELANKGWVPIDQIVPIGNAACWDNCLCHYIFGKRRSRYGTITII